MECPVTEVLRGKVFKDKLIAGFQPQGTGPPLQDLLYPHLYLEAIQVFLSFFLAAGKRILFRISL